jgi:uncharacterized protein YvpB
MKKTGPAVRLAYPGAFLAVLACSLFRAGAVRPDPSAATPSAARTRPSVPHAGNPVTPSYHPAESDFPPSGATPTLCDANLAFGTDGSILPAPSLPAAAVIRNIRGRRQSLPLDCESRSAVDWAGYFGVEIDELEFFNKIPASDNPDEGFVGSVYGSWGNLPPNPYGVHAGPVAFLLRYYGLSAYAYRGMSWDQLRVELAARRPVIVWVAGHVWRSTPVTITVTGGDAILVARLEHTVILVGYTEKMATVLDGASSYSVDTSAFAASWSTLGNMAVVGRILPARPDCAGRAVELVP